jgi:hypothetical protein
MVETLERASAPTQPAAAFRPAEVVAVTADGGYRVRPAGAPGRAVRPAQHALAQAGRCAVGSRVLLADDGAGGAYVIGVLDHAGADAGARAGGPEAEEDGGRLVLRDPDRGLMVAYDPATGELVLSPGAVANLALAAPDGDIALRAGRNLRFEGTASAHLETDRLTLRARSALFAATAAIVRADALTATIRRVRQASSRLEVSAGRIVERAGSVFRRASGLYRQDVGRMRVTVAETCDLGADKLDLRAKGEAKLDGEQIRLG